MSLNIKNEEACRLAAELAELTGTTKTGAIKAALQDKLEKERHARSVHERLAKMQDIAERCAKLLGPGPSAVEHGDYLYDENGLPK